MASRVVDTFPAFLAWWKRAKGLPLPAQVDSWTREYMAGWPELLAKQEECYAQDGLDWREVARERVFPALPARLTAMVRAHDILLEACGPVHARVRQALGWESDVAFVLYVGVGCGAGWATRYDGMPAVLFGLENVAECGWTEPAPLYGMTAHELGHLAHQDWRAPAGLGQGYGPWWDLYEEGFAQRLEHVVLGAEAWHMASGYLGPGWVTWCRDHIGWLAGEYLRRADAGEDVRPFFGSWFDICGHSQTGYFLGHEVVVGLQRELTLREITLLSHEEIEGRCRAALAALSALP